MDWRGKERRQLGPRAIAAVGIAEESHQRERHYRSVEACGQGRRRQRGHERREHAGVGRCQRKKERVIAGLGIRMRGKWAPQW
jgi:hypothetical protein